MRSIHPEPAGIMPRARSKPPSAMVWPRQANPREPPRIAVEPQRECQYRCGEARLPENGTLTSITSGLAARLPHHYSEFRGLTRNNRDAIPGYRIVNDDKSNPSGVTSNTIKPGSESRPAVCRNQSDPLSRVGAPNQYRCRPVCGLRPATPAPNV